jgi:hypothetical protein
MIAESFARQWAGLPVEFRAVIEREREYGEIPHIPTSGLVPGYEHVEYCLWGDPAPFSTVMAGRAWLSVKDDVFTPCTDAWRWTL